MSKITARSRKGFTLIELLLVIAIIGLLASLSMIGYQQQQAKRRDVRRVNNIVELRKALALYANATGGYPTMDGCINGTDIVTASLRSKGYVGEGVKLVDPLYPNDPAKCYIYKGGGPTFTLTYTLETNSASTGKSGPHTVVP